MTIKIIEGRVRKYISKSIFQILRNRFMSSRVSGKPQNLFVEKSVELLRHPKNIFLSDIIIIKEGSKFCPNNKDATLKLVRIQQ